MTRGPGGRRGRGRAWLTLASPAITPPPESICHMPCQLPAEPGQQPRPLVRWQVSLAPASGPFQGSRRFCRKLSFSVLASCFDKYDELFIIKQQNKSKEPRSELRGIGIELRTEASFGVSNQRKTQDEIKCLFFQRRAPHARHTNPAASLACSPKSESPSSLERATAGRLSGPWRGCI